jgi:NADP-dependent 3-hydroxy acid dehydrogenase YdfG
MAAKNSTNSIHKNDNSDRLAVITGASSGIGAAIAESLAAAGFPVALGARRVERLEEVADRIQQQGGTAFVHALDVTRAASVDSFFKAIERKVGNPAVVVNNAGLSTPGLLHELEVADIERDLNTNLLGPMLVARRALPSMLADGGGDLVFITSLNAALPRPFQVPYTASKAGVEAMVRTLQMELEGTGVRATSVRPGPTVSEFGNGWTPAIIERVLTAWTYWGALHHHQYLDANRIGDAVVSVVTAPPGTHIDLIQINPEAPVKR